MSALMRFALAPLSCGALLVVPCSVLANSLEKDVAPTTQVTGGQEGGECAWPGVVVVKSIPTGSTQEFLCSGTLIHPQVVLYAGHCGVASTVIFGEKWQALKLKSFKKAAPHPMGNTGFGTPNTPMDWAYAVLEKPLKGTPIIPIAAGPELAELIKDGGSIVHAGYSANNAKAPTKIVDHHLKWADNRIHSLSAGAINTSSGNGNVTTCPGDSGGPLLAKTAKGGWRVIGISSSKTGGCGAAMTANAFSRVRAEMVAWIEKESGIDVTPCFDESGKATPSWQCDAFMAYAGDPRSPQGKWEEGACKDAKVVPAKEAAGIPDSGESKPKDPEGEEPKDEDPKDEDPKDPDDKDSEGDDEESSGDEGADDSDGEEGEDVDKGEDGTGDTGAGKAKKKKNKKKGKKKKSAGKAKGEPERTSQGGCLVAGGSGGTGAFFGLLLLLGLRRRR